MRLCVITRQSGVPNQTVEKKSDCSCFMYMQNIVLAVLAVQWLQLGRGVLMVLWSHRTSESFP